MPFKWVKPEFLFEYKGIKVYKAYRSENYIDPLKDWFTTDIDENPEYEFKSKDVKKDIDDGKIKVPNR